MRLSPDSEYHTTAVHIISTGIIVIIIVILLFRLDYI